MELDYDYTLSLFIVMGATWIRRGLRNLTVHAEVQSNLVKPAANNIVANDDNYALAA